jgi:hypothetical protein
MNTGGLIRRKFADSPEILGLPDSLPRIMGVNEKTHPGIWIEKTIQEFNEHNPSTTRS